MIWEERTEMRRQLDEGEEGERGGEGGGGGRGRKPGNVPGEWKKPNDKKSGEMERQKNAFGIRKTNPMLSPWL